MLVVKLRKTPSLAINQCEKDNLWTLFSYFLTIQPAKSPQDSAYCRTTHLLGGFNPSRTSGSNSAHHLQGRKITLLRVIPTMTFIHFVTGKSSGILSGISSGISSDILSGILSGKSSGILSDILSGISSGILSGFWGLAVRTELGRPQVEVQRCALSSAGPRLRSVRTELGRSQVEVQRCALSWKVPGWGPAVRTELRSWRRAWPRVGKATVDVEGRQRW